MLMPKTGLKAFICSFSVSLFAIMAANRAFWHEEPLKEEPLDISGKNIVLFLKNSSTAHFPVKKIALSALPEIAPKPASTPQPEVILASVPEDWEFPLEFESAAPPADKDVTEAPPEKPVVLADVVYSQDKPLAMPKIEAEPVYEPQRATEQPKQIAAAPIYQPEEPALRAPELKTADKADKKPVAPTAQLQPAEDPDAAALKLARAETAAVIPLQTAGGQADGNKKVKIGDPGELNHIAMSEDNIPIQSMEKELDKTSAVNDKPAEKDWQPMNDSPWIVAKAGGGAKNQMALKEFAGKSDQDIKQALYANKQRPEVQIASETVKNLIIPIPDDIMQDEDLTPKLAYPSTSEDAEKEKIINAQIKRQEKAAEVKIEDLPLLSPIEEEVVLDAPGTTPAAEAEKVTAAATPKNEPPAPEPQKAEKEQKSGILGTLGSIFNRSAQTIDEAKEKAIAKARIKRSLKKKQAQARPVSIMPKEIRLSFQPNRAEISGQTLRWVQAFATKAAEAPDIALEIRIDGTSATDLQQKRLNLLHNILSNKGVEYSKINTVFTSREPNSFILRTISLDNNTGGSAGKTNNGSGPQYIQW